MNELGKLETKSQDLAQVSFEPTAILLPQSPECWDYRNRASRLGLIKNRRKL